MEYYNASYKFRLRSSDQKMQKTLHNLVEQCLESLLTSHWEINERRLSILSLVNGRLSEMYSS